MVLVMDNKIFISLLRRPFKLILGNQLKTTYVIADSETIGANTIKRRHAMDFRKLN